MKILKNKKALSPVVAVIIIIIVVTVVVAIAVATWTGLLIFLEVEKAEIETNGQPVVTTTSGYREVIYDATINAQAEDYRHFAIIRTTRFEEPRTCVALTVYAWNNTDIAPLEIYVTKGRQSGYETLVKNGTISYGETFRWAKDFDINNYNTEEEYNLIIGYSKVHLIDPDDPTLPEKYPEVAFRVKIQDVI